MVQLSPLQHPLLLLHIPCCPQGLFSPPDPTPGSRFSKGIQARAELLQDIGELVRQREESKEAAAAAGSSTSSSSGGAGASKLHKNVLDYTLDDQRTWVSQH